MENQLYTVCQQCNTNCGIRVKTHEGRVHKIEGNPYSPWTKTPHIPYATPLHEAATQEGALCPKGYAGIQSVYDPYRVRKVLKRVGKRGENTWQSIDFHQAVQEIVQGGNLFHEGHVQGLQDIATLKDPQIFASLARDAQRVAAKEISLEDFKAQHQEHLHHLIDPNHPDLGPKNNQICYSWGRQKGGRTEFIKRFFNANIGSVNTHGHTTVCQGSLYFTCKAMSEQFVEGKFCQGQKFYWQADTEHAKFILFVGANPMGANYGPPLRAGKLSTQRALGQQKIAVVDPRHSATAARAWKWLPIRSQGVAALGMGMLHYILENHRYAASYLKNCNKGAALAQQESTWSQAAWLVKIRPDGSTGDFLRASDLGHAPQQRAKAKVKKNGKEGTWNFDAFVSLQEGQPLFFDPNDADTQAQGELFVSTTLQGIKVKSVLQIYREEARAKSLQEWAEEAGTTVQELQELAQEFCSHGRQAVVDIHRGVSQHSNGFYNVAIWMLINVLMGNHDYKGGLAKASTYDINGKGGLHAMQKSRDQVQPWGISLIRHGVNYESTTLFKGYPAPRPWYPFASDIYQEIIPSAGDMYPYQIKALFLYMAAPTYSLPAGNALIPILANPKKIPLIIASDIIVGETSMYADYIFPDVSYLERWEFPGSHPSQVCKVAPCRQPVIQPLTDTVRVFGQEQHLCLETLLLGIAEHMQLPGFGAHGFAQNSALCHQDDFYLRQVANIAFGEKNDGSEKVPAASAAEMQLFLQARKHLSKVVFDEQRWKDIVGKDMWPHVVTVLQRGGRFQDAGEAYVGEKLRNSYGKMLNIYFEHIGRAKSSMTGKPFIAHAKALHSPVDCMGNALPDAHLGYDLTLITYKSISQCKTRTSGNTWLRNIHEENFIEISAHDAARLDLKENDWVHMRSASNMQGMWFINQKLTIPLSAKVRISQGLRPGIVAFSLGYGHWANGCQDMTIDGIAIEGDVIRRGGINANAAMRVDPVLQNTCLTDPIGASAVFYQSLVKLEKIEPPCPVHMA